MTIFLTSIRDFFALLDMAIYNLISAFFNIFETIANYQILAPEFISNISSRIYAFIGLFMIFKISFSLINYLVDPNKISDKTAGAGNLIKRVVISLILIIIVPFGFDLLREAQSAILSDNLIAKMIVGEQETTNKKYNVLMDGYDGNTMCVDGSGETIYAKTDNPGNYVGLLAFKTFYKINNKYRTTELGGDGKSIYDITFIKAYCSGGGDSASAQKLLFLGIHNSPYNLPGMIDDAIKSTFNSYYIDYSWLLSTVVGVLIVLLIISLAFDIAVRAVKLLFLEIIAPVPIISYIEPDTNKNKIFSKWIKDVGTTWLGLFIRMAAIYFVVELISILSVSFSDKSNLLFTGGYDSYAWGPLVTLTFIIGLLMFAKQIPKLIEEIFGIKSTGFTLNPLKKIKDGALLGAGIAGVAYGTAGALGGGISGFRAGIEGGSPFRGAAFGAISGGMSGKDNKSMKDSFSKSMNQTYKNMTGSEFANFSPSRALMNFDGKGTDSVAEVKHGLDVARSKLNQEHSKLNVAQHTSALASEELRRRGIDPTEMSQKDLDTRFEELKKSRETSNNLNKEIENNLAKQNKLSETMKSFQNLGLTDSKEYMDAAREMNSLKNSHAEYTKAIGEIDFDSSKYSSFDEEYSALETLKNYRKSVESETEIRANISKIEKDISTLSDEKKQRERLYNIDTSTKNSVKEAMSRNME